jgi:hypothetical protein
MQDILDIIKNIEMVYENNTSFQILKDFERVVDELDIYVYKNWIDGELAAGPTVERHWVTCTFMWPYEKMPDPKGGKRLLDYDCKISYKKSFLLKPRKIKSPDDIRPGTKKGKLDREPIWLVRIQMPKNLIADVYQGYIDNLYDEEKEAREESETNITQPQDADVLSGGVPSAAPAAAPGAAPPVQGVL